MRSHYYLYLYIFAILVNIFVAVFIHEPGYMDAEYYYAGAIRIADGSGWVEPYIWNYLTSPHELPIPSFAYWMPLTSLVSSAGMILTGSSGFFAARIVLLLISGLIPLITAKLALIFLGETPGTLLAGIISVFSAFYLPYIANTDSFTLYIVLGGMLLIYLNKLQKQDYRWWNGLILGLITGLLHLSRADGLIVFVFLAGVMFISLVNAARKKSGIQRRVFCLISLVVGYAIIMSPWYLRNLSIYNTLMPTGNSKLLWSTTYNDIFSANPDKLNFATFLDLGLTEIVLTRIRALWMNIKSILAVNGSIFLTPLILVGLWRTRKNHLTRVAGSLILINLITMSFLFPFAGYRGGFFHSNSIAQTILWALVPVGLTGFINLGEKIRQWNIKQAWKFFSFAIIAGLVCLSGFLVFQRINPASSPGIAWNGRLAGFRELDRAIIETSGDTISNIMVNDPPGYFLASGRGTVVTPTDDVATIIETARLFQVRFIILDENNTKINNELMTTGFPNDQAKLLMEINGRRIYEIAQD